MLNRDIHLGYDSVSMVDGHAGTTITFVAATREAVFSHWCMREKSACCPLEGRNIQKREARTDILFRGISIQK